jgi:hypothetical protein
MFLQSIKKENILPLPADSVNGAIKNILLAGFLQMPEKKWDSINVHFPGVRLLLLLSHLCIYLLLYYKLRFPPET